MANVPKLCLVTRYLHINFVKYRPLFFNRHVQVSRFTSRNQSQMLMHNIKLNCHRYTCIRQLHILNPRTARTKLTALDPHLSQTWDNFPNYQKTFYAIDTSQFSWQNERFKAYLEHLETKLNEGQDKDKYNHALNALVELVNEVRTKYGELEELKELAKDDVWVHDMVENERQEYLDAIQELQDSIVEMLCEGKDSQDVCDVVLEVECGAGGQESMMFAKELLDMYQSYAQYKGWDFSVVSMDATVGAHKGRTAIRKAVVCVGGADVYGRLKFEGGIHRVKRVPITESGGRVHTSTVAVAVLPQAAEIDKQPDPKDLKIETYRPSGPGGQNAMKCESAVRVRHIPTGTVATCESSRSQHVNVKQAIQVLTARILQVEERKQTSKLMSQRKLQFGDKSRSERIRTFVYAQHMVVDHRLDQTYRDVNDFLSGTDTLDGTIDDLVEMAKLESLEAKLDEFERTNILKKKSTKKAKS